MWHLATTPPCGSKRATLHSYNGGLLQNERWKVKGFDQLRFQSVQHLNSKRARGLKRATLHSCHPSVATFTLLSKHSCFFFVFPACYLSRKLCNTLPVTSEQASLTQADKLFNPISNFLFLKFSCWIPFVCLQICVSCFLIFPEKRVYLKAGLFDPAEKLVKTIMACLSSIHIISFLSFIDPFLLAILREQKVCLQIKGHK